VEGRGERGEGREEERREGRSKQNLSVKMSFSTRLKSEENMSCGKRP
jgi:hypothetical protein